MHHSRTRWLLLGLVSAAACLSAACGSSASDGSEQAAAFEEPTAVSANAAGSSPDAHSPNVKGATNKVDPTVRPGVEAPLDSMPDPGSALDLPSAPIDGAVPAPETATRLFASGFGSGVTLTAPEGFRNGDQHLTGADSDGHAFPIGFWSPPHAGWTSWVLSSVGEVTPAPVTDFLTASLKNVAGRNGGFTTALSLNSLVRSGGGGNQYIAVQNKNMGVEPVMYQRMWVKFDGALASRASSTGAADFQQTFWEASAPDYRMQLKLRYDAAGLYWQATADRMDGGGPAWQSDLKTAPIVLAAADSAAGWHRVEVLMDRPNGRFKVAVDGQMLVDHANGLPGDSRSRIQLLRMMMFNSGKAQLGEMLFDDLEIWDAPPVDAWVAR